MKYRVFNTEQEAIEAQNEIYKDFIYNRANSNNGYLDDCEETPIKPVLIENINEEDLTGDRFPLYGQRAFQTAGITENDAGGLFVGANNVGSSTINLDLAEIIIVHSALSTEQRQLLEGYLAWKWGLQASLPLGHPYYNFPPSQ